MRFFHKKPTQEAINALKNYYREKKEQSNWNDNTFDKASVKSSLVAEQSHLCAYCMQRIEDTHKTSIEHWKDREGLKAMGNIQEIFEYNNLLAVCKGHLGQPDSKGKDKKHCDASRSDGNRPLSVKPSERKTLEHIGYLKNGRIYAKCALNDLSVKANGSCSKYQEKKEKPLCNGDQKCAHCDLDCDKGLNLNALTIMNNRKKVLSDLQITLERFCKNPDFAKNEAEKKRIITHFVNNAKHGELKPYIGIVEFFYKKYL